MIKCRTGGESGSLSVMFSEQYAAVAAMVARGWRRHNGFGVTIRIALISIGTFLSILATYSESDHARDLAARAQFDHDPRLDEFARTESDAEADERPFRILVLGSSEAGNPGWQRTDGDCRMLAECLAKHLAPRVPRQVDVRYAYVPPTPGARAQRLSTLAEQNLDIDLIIVTYAIHNATAEIGAPIDEARDSAESTARSRLPATDHGASWRLPSQVFTSSPQTVLSAILSHRFYSYESRFRYSLGQRIPFATRTVVTTIEQESNRSPAGDIERSARIGPERNLNLERQIQFLGTMPTEPTSVAIGFEQLSETPRPSGTELLVVLTPYGKDFFDNTQQRHLADIATLIVRRAQIYFDTESIWWLNGFDLYDNVPDVFADPVHVYSHGHLAAWLGTALIEREDFTALR